MDNYTSSLTQRELDILFGFLRYHLEIVASIISDSKLKLEFITFQISGHQYKVGVDEYKENALFEGSPMISIPCEVENA